QLGRKSGRGFYEWRRGEAVKERETPKPTAEMTDRLILPMLDVCVTCLREGVVADEDTLDGAMIFATGFAPFRGGAPHYPSAAGPCTTRARAASPTSAPSSNASRNATANASGPIRAGTA